MSTHRIPRYWGVGYAGTPMEMGGGVCIRPPDIGYTYVHAHMVCMYPWGGGGMLYRVRARYQHTLPPSSAESWGCWSLLGFGFTTSAVGFSRRAENQSTPTTTTNHGTDVTALSCSSYSSTARIYEAEKSDD